MASQVTDWGAEQWMSVLVGLISVPSEYWIALASAEPGTGIDGSQLAALEPSALGSASYQRQSIASGGAAWALAGNGYVTNTIDVDFGFPDVSWGLLPYFAICDGQNDGDLYAYGEFTSTGTFDPTFQVILPAGALTLRAVSVLPSIVPA